MALETEADIEALVRSITDPQVALIHQLQGILRQGNGSPQGVIAAPVGHLYRRLDGGASTTLYIKETGGATNTGWRAV